MSISCPGGILFHEAGRYEMTRVKMFLPMLLLGLAAVAGCDRSDTQGQTGGNDHSRAGEGANPTEAQEAESVGTVANDAVPDSMPSPLLGEPEGDCAIARRVYDFSFPRDNPAVTIYEAAMDLLDGATAFVSDNCDPARIVMDVNGDSVALARITAGDSDWMPGSEHAYAGDGFEVDIDVGDPIASFPHQEGGMTLCLVRAVVMIRGDDRQWSIDGTASYFSALVSGRCA
jgi:hypothetical protein